MDLESRRERKVVGVDGDGGSGLGYDMTAVVGGKRRVMQRQTDTARREKHRSEGMRQHPRYSPRVIRNNG